MEENPLTLSQERTSPSMIKMMAPLYGLEDGIDTMRTSL